MLAHVDGQLTYKSPTMVVIDCQGVGYEIHISLNTYEKINPLQRVRLFTHLSIKEDAHTLYGFFEESERALFRHLISVNGIGPSTGRMILSSLSPAEIFKAISQGNVSLLTTIKGVGPKSAQRIVLELQDKLRKDGTPFGSATPESGSTREESIGALLMLGFNRNNTEKEVDKLLRLNPDWNVEEVIKAALRNL